MSGVVDLEVYAGELGDDVRGRLRMPATIIRLHDDAG